MTLFGDLLFLETLLAGTPIRDINTPNEEEKEEVLVTKKKIKPPLHIQDSLPVPLPPPREKASEYMDQNSTPHFSFGPGKSKIRWPNLFQLFKRIFNFTNCFLVNNGEHKEVNGLDKGWIKYKLPDLYLDFS